jgi:alpha-ketoglutarate-dependent taurine dioxygenase
VTNPFSPPDQPIPFHHELAQTPNPPRYIFFYCDVPSESGGHTPIIDSTAVYRFAKVRRIKRPDIGAGSGFRSLFQYSLLRRLE